MNLNPPPIVLVLAGNDPCGGAGLCADIQALASQGCHTAPVITSITIQNTLHLLDNFPLSGMQVAAQAQAVIVDVPIAAIKIGLLGCVEIIEAIQPILFQYSYLPIVLDPVLAAGSGYSLADVDVRQAIIKDLLPLIQIITPNSEEARLLTGKNQLDDAAANLMDAGCSFVCITGTHEDTPMVINTLYGQGRKLESWYWPRLLNQYHGSGCTFAASLAGLLAQGNPINQAVYDAQHYTWNSLQYGYQAGKGQALPNRLYQPANCLSSEKK
ncbi:MAG: hydroxymethylpyrimidine/phosphomethylpyrimidine kinase [Thioploca sp.]|nr:hydroxymethylpyrimidine/phosphomethylpyrimidine kinase [Thioploca sp.]